MPSWPTSLLMDFQLKREHLALLKRVEALEGAKEDEEEDSQDDRVTRVLEALDTRVFPELQALSRRQQELQARLNETDRAHKLEQDELRDKLTKLEKRQSLANDQQSIRGVHLQPRGMPNTDRLGFDTSRLLDRSSAFVNQHTRPVSTPLRDPNSGAAIPSATSTTSRTYFDQTEPATVFGKVSSRRSLAHNTTQAQQPSSPSFADAALHTSTPIIPASRMHEAELQVPKKQTVKRNAKGRFVKQSKSKGQEVSAGQNTTMPIKRTTRSRPLAPTERLASPIKNPETIIRKKRKEARDKQEDGEDTEDEESDDVADENVNPWLAAYRAARLH